MTGAGVAVLLRRGDAQTDQEQAQEQLEELVAATAESFAAVAGPDDELIECESWQEGAARATAPYALMLRAGDRLEPGALRALSGFAQARSARLITADRIESGRIRRCPRWSPGLMEQMPYAGRALLVDTGLLAGEPEAQGPGQGQSGQSVWGPRPPRSEWDLQLRLACAAGGAEHCPVVALHQAQPVEVGDLGERIATTREHLERQGRQGRGERVIPGPTGWPRVVAGEAPTGMVSIIVPTAFSARPTQDGGTRVLVEGLLSALAETIDAARTEVVLVVGESTGPEPIERCRALWPGRLEVATTRGAFNFAAAINAGADASSGDLLLLLNDDVEPIRPGWLEDMLAVLGRPGVGAVGARLLFPDGTIQHLGVICPPVGLATHPRVGEPDDPTHPMAQADVDYLAVTGACLLYRRADHLALGGWDESLPLNFNDVDLCLRMASGGQRIICVNSVRLLHRESSTRQPNIRDHERRAYESWRELTAADPHIEYWG